jgi:hypothetical protein
VAAHGPLGNAADIDPRRIGLCACCGRFWADAGGTSLPRFSDFGYGRLGGIQTPAPYAAVVSRWFDRDRGISRGMATAGVGLGVASILQLAAFLIKSAGMAVWFGAIGCCLGVAACLDVRARRGVRGCVRRPQRGDGYALGAATIEVRDRPPICKSLWLTKGAGDHESPATATW